MTAREALAEGLLHRAVELQQAHISTNANDSAGKLFLFELLILAGKRKAAQLQLDEISSPDPDWPAVKRSFRQLLRAIRRRERFERPRIFAPASAHLRARWRATRAAITQHPRSSRFADWADAIFPEAFGFVDGREFFGLRDADDRFAGVFEVLLGPWWVWVGLEQVKKLTLQPPAAVLDVAYRPGQLRLGDGREFAVTIPLISPGSAKLGEDFALGQTIDWQEVGGLTVSLGAKVFATGEEELALGECRMFEIRG